MTTTIPLSASGAHLVCSVPLVGAEAVFRSIVAEIGDRVRRIPGGETGPRSDRIVWPLPVFGGREAFRRCWTHVNCVRP